MFETGDKILSNQKLKASINKGIPEIYWYNIQVFSSKVNLGELQIDDTDD
jgi:hypothetical protein